VGVGTREVAHAVDYRTVTLLQLGVVKPLRVIVFFANNWVVDFVLDADVLDLLQLPWALLFYQYKPQKLLHVIEVVDFRVF